MGLSVGSWFEDNLQRKDGNRDDTFTWTDPTLGCIPFRHRLEGFFSCLEISGGWWADMFWVGMMVEMLEIRGRGCLRGRKSF